MPIVFEISLYKCQLKMLHDVSIRIASACFLNLNGVNENNIKTKAHAKRFKFLTASVFTLHFIVCMLAPLFYI